jgi:drug/metabolite transporter (DMT)-like permease
VSPALFGLILINIVLLTAGQTLWKIGLGSVGFSLSFTGILKLLFNPFVFAGLAVYVAATVLWLYILSRAELSAAYPLQSLCYILAALIGLFVFKEDVSLMKWAGLVLISAGAFFVARG